MSGKLERKRKVGVGVGVGECVYMEEEGSIAAGGVELQEPCRTHAGEVYQGRALPTTVWNS